VLRGVVSPEELQSAWERVRENNGCRGVDGVTVERFAHGAAGRLRELVTRIDQGVYRPMPLLRIEVEKKPGSPDRRKLLVPAIADRIAQTALARQLNRVWDEEFLETSFAYRRGHGVDSAIARVVQLRNRGWQWVVETDLVKFFDNVPQGLLLQEVAKEVEREQQYTLLRRWIHAEEWDGESVTRLRRGIAQGSPISPLLANLFLSVFDREVTALGHHIVRYADDFVALCETETKAAALLEWVRDWMARRQLTLHPDKTRVTSFAAGFNFLGPYFHGGEVYLKWKENKAHGRVKFMAQPMPARLLEKYRVPLRLEGQEADRRAYTTWRRDLKAAEKEELVPYLYVTEAGSIVRKSGDRLLIERDGRMEADIPVHRLEHVCLFGNAQLTTAAMVELLERGVPVSLYTRTGRYRGRLQPPAAKNVDLRIAQYGLHQDAAKALDWGRKTVAAKIANGAWVLRRYDSRDGGGDSAGQAIERLDSLVARSGSAETVAELEGVEGAAAREYFTALMRFQTSAFQWPGRVQHPATDPINALLSLTYTLAMGELMGFGEAAGLDIYLGYLHQPDYGRPSLALDLLEPLRHPVCDRLVLALLQRKQFGPDDFEVHGDTGGMFLRAPALKEFFAAYEKWMATKVRERRFRDLARDEVGRLAKALKGESDWTPIQWGNDWNN